MRRPWIVFLVVVLGVLAPVLAGAQPAAPNAANARKTAIETANKGQELFDAGKYAEALVEFQKADAQFHAPTFTIMIARAYDKRGKLLEARKVYQQVVDEKLAHYAPQAFFEAQKEAKTELDALLPRIPTVHVVVTGAPAKDVHLTIDGRDEVLGQPVSRDPGDHAIAAAAPGRVTATRSIKLEQGAKLQVTLELVPMRPPAAAAGASPLRPSPQASQPSLAETDEANPYFAPGVATLTIGGVALTIGVVTGVLALGKVDELDRLCDLDRCYDNAGNTYDDAGTLGTLSTVSFVIGSLALGTGVVFLATGGSQEPVQTALAVGPGWVGVKGMF